MDPTTLNVTQRYDHAPRELREEYIDQIITRVADLGICRTIAEGDPATYRLIGRLDTTDDLMFHLPLVIYVLITPRLHELCVKIVKSCQTRIFLFAISKFRDLPEVKEFMNHPRTVEAITTLSGILKLDSKHLFTLLKKGDYRDFAKLVLKAGSTLDPVEYDHLLA